MKSRIRLLVISMATRRQSLTFWLETLSMELAQLRQAVKICLVVNWMVLGREMDFWMWQIFLRILRDLALIESKVSK